MVLRRKVLQKTLLSASSMFFPSFCVTAQNTKVYETDILVIGAGASGLAACLSAKDSGCRVVLVDAADAEQSTTSLSWGYFNATDALLQGRVGIEDSPDRHFHQVLEHGGDRAFPELVSLVCYSAPSSLDWLKFLGVQFDTKIFQVPLGLYPRTHKILGGGRKLVSKLMEAVNQRKVDFFRNTKIVQLERQRAQGWIARSDKGIEFRAKKGCILATGGFRADSARLKSLWPQLKNVPWLGSKEADGVLLKEAERIGASSIGLDSIQLVLIEKKSNKFHFGPYPLGILLDSKGDRFIREDAVYERICSAITNLPESRATFLWEGGSSQFLPEACSKGVKRYNQWVLQKQDLDFMKDKKFLKPLRDVSQLELEPRGFATLGGLRITPKTEVISRQGNIIPDLFACGELVGGLHGRSMSIGQSLTTCIVLGRLAGRMASA